MRNIDKNCAFMPLPHKQGKATGTTKVVSLKVFVKYLLVGKTFYRVAKKRKAPRSVC